MKRGDIVVDTRGNYFAVDVMSSVNGEAQVEIHSVVTKIPYVLPKALADGELTVIPGVSERL